MKRPIIFTLLMACFLVPSFAQETWKEGSTMEISGNTYEVSSPTKYNRLVIQNISKNIIDTREPISIQGMIPPMKNSDTQIDTALQKQVIFDVLQEKWEQLVSNKELIRINYVFGQDRKVSSVDFSLNENTVISPRELDEIDDRLRKGIKATFLGRTYPYHFQIYHTQEIYF